MHFSWIFSYYLYVPYMFAFILHSCDLKNVSFLKLTVECSDGALRCQNWCIAIFPTISVHMLWDVLRPERGESLHLTSNGPTTRKSRASTCRCGTTELIGQPHKFKLTRPDLTAKTSTLPQKRRKQNSSVIHWPLHWPDSIILYLTTGARVALCWASCLCISNFL